MFADPEKTLAASPSQRPATEQKIDVASPAQPRQGKSSAYPPSAEGKNDGERRGSDEAVERQPGKQPGQQLPAAALKEPRSRAAEAAAEADRGEGEDEEKGEPEPEEGPEEPERPIPQLTGSKP